MRIAVGSTNPAKLAPVHETFSRHFQQIDVIGLDVSSDVSEQPVTDEETFRGARNRAIRALETALDASFGVGIESGLQRCSYGWLEHSLIVILSREGTIGIGASAGVVLPDQVIERVCSGETLEQVIDDYFGTHRIGEGIGMFGLLTDGTVTRAHGIQHGVALALARFLHNDFFSGNPSEIVLLHDE
jgi:inosine/xanthosine triphosphatase